MTVWDIAPPPIGTSDPELCRAAGATCAAATTTGADDRTGTDRPAERSVRDGVAFVGQGDKFPNSRQSPTTKTEAAAEKPRRGPPTTTRTYATDGGWGTGGRGGGAMAMKPTVRWTPSRRSQRRLPSVHPRAEGYEKQTTKDAPAPVGPENDGRMRGDTENGRVADGRHDVGERQRRRSRFGRGRSCRGGVGGEGGAPRNACPLRRRSHVHRRHHHRCGRSNGHRPPGRAERERSDRRTVRESTAAVAELREIFSLVDADGGGTIDCDELGRLYDLLGMHREEW